MRYFFLVLIFIFSCKSKTSVPDDVLQPNKMETVLQDLMRSDVFVDDYILSRDTTLNKDATHIDYYNQVFALHKISKEEFQKSFNYYKSHPALLETVMDSIGKTKAPTKLLPSKIIDDTLATIEKVSPKQDTLIRHTPKRKKIKQYK